MLKSYPKGIPSLNIEPFDDFRPNDLQLWDTPRVGGNWITFRLRDQLISGCENATVIRVSGFEKDPTKTKNEIELRIPRIVHRSTYDMEMRWLSMVHANSSGPCYAEFQNVTLTLNLKVIVKFQKEKRYLKIYELVPEVQLGRSVIFEINFVFRNRKYLLSCRFSLVLDDLYKENLDLTLAINRVYNENWIELWNDVEYNVVSTYSRKGAQLLDKIFATLSYDDMFLINREF